MTDEEELKETPDTEVTVEPSLEEEIETDPEKEKIAEEECKKTKKFGWLKELLVYLVIIILCVTFVPKYVIQRTQVDGHSMETTLHDEENLIVEKVTYHFKNPDRFDIITFYPKGRNADEYYIKRVIGLPGETIQIKGDTIYINGNVLKEYYGLEPMLSGGIAKEPIKLGKDEFFVLGDNRNESRDSRDGESVDVVKKKNIDGHAILRIYPFSRVGKITHEQQRVR